ncbi:MAG: hypothetical protein ACP5UI_03435 [Thermoprotei archaeon]|nr:hypothetical protein [TACK group archaeon]
MGIREALDRIALLYLRVVGSRTSIPSGMRGCQGYGGLGEVALMSMLQPCTLGVAVVNIDPGIAAGAIVAQVTNKIHENCKAQE